MMDSVRVFMSRAGGRAAHRPGDPAFRAGRWIFVLAGLRPGNAGRSLWGCPDPHPVSPQPAWREWGGAWQPARAAVLGYTLALTFTVGGLIATSRGSAIVFDAFHPVLDGWVSRGAAPMALGS